MFDFQLPTVESVRATHLENDKRLIRERVEKAVNELEPFVSAQGLADPTLLGEAAKELQAKGFFVFVKKYGDQVDGLCISVYASDKRILSSQ